jgi:hypothetical protein
LTFFSYSTFLWGNCQFVLRTAVRLRIQQSNAVISSSEHPLNRLEYHKSTSIKSNIINIRAQIVFCSILLPSRLTRSTLYHLFHIVEFVSIEEEKKAGKHIQTLSNFCYWMLIALSIMYDCFIKTKTRSVLNAVG